MKYNVLTYSIICLDYYYFVCCICGLNEMRQRSVIKICIYFKFAYFEWIDCIKKLPEKNSIWRFKIHTRLNLLLHCI